MSMTPEQVVAWLRQEAPHGELSADSRRLSPGDVFVAYPGDAGDGRNFIADALARGAAAVVYESEQFSSAEALTVPSIGVAQLRQQAGIIANLWYGQPDATLFAVAVTGTNGKTSCSQWLADALSRLDGPAAVVGTLGTGLFRAGVVDQLAQTGYTTPDSILLQRRLAGLHAAGATSLAIEASSIGLDQHRLIGMHVDVALLTNLTRDHLDYHGDMTSYEAAKAILFDWPGLRSAVLNHDDAAGRRMIARLQSRSPQVALWSYSVSAAEPVAGVATLRASEIRSTAAGTIFQLASPLGNALVRTHLVGTFNVSNVLGVIGVLLAKGHSLKAVIEVIETLRAVPGRMQQFGGVDAPLVVIDYAHTPDALEKTLATLQPVAQQRGGRLWCVFGCGGDRDPGKRAQMGAIGVTADALIITSDNPRNEVPAEIIAQIVAGTSTHPRSNAVQVIEDRAAAILWAVRHAEKSDVVLLAGKGHEDYQDVRGKKLPFLDADHAALALATRATTRGHV